MSTYHMAEMLRREFVVSEIEHFEARFAELRRDLLSTALPGYSDADKDARSGVVADAVIELGEAATSNKRAELFQTSRSFRNSDGKQRLFRLTYLRALSHKSQAIKVHVRATRHCHKGLPRKAMGFCIRLHAGDRHRSRWFRHAPGVQEDVLDGGTHLVGVDQYVVVNKCPAQSKRFRANSFHRGAIGKQSNLGQRDSFAGAHAAHHRIGINHLYTYYFYFWAHGLHERRHSRRQSTAADRHEHRVDRSGMLAGDLHTNRSLPGDHIRVVEGVHKRQPLRHGQDVGVNLRFRVRLTVNHHLDV